MKWQQGLFNLFLECDGFHISYVPDTSIIISHFAGDTIDETSIVTDSETLVLNGDFRKQYEELIPLGFDSCLEFYYKNKAKHGSSWSSDITLQ